jgi:hypothetical protein
MIVIPLLFEQREIKGNAGNLMQLSAPGLRALFLFVHLTVERDYAHSITVR